MVFKRLFALLLASAVLLTGCACSPGEDEPKDTATPAPTAPVRTPEPSLSIHNGSGMVAAGGVHTIGVRTDGTLLSAGHNSKGQREVAQAIGVSQMTVSRVERQALQKMRALLNGEENT